MTRPLVDDDSSCGFQLLQRRDSADVIHCACVQAIACNSNHFGRSLERSHLTRRRSCRSQLRFLATDDARVLLESGDVISSIIMVEAVYYLSVRLRVIRDRVLLRERSTKSHEHKNCHFA